MSGANVVLHVGLLHAGVVADAAAQREHPLLLVHMERHVADKLSVQLRLEVAHMAAGRRRREGERERERKRKEDGENNRRGDRQPRSSHPGCGKRSDTPEKTFLFNGFNSPTATANT